MTADYFSSLSSEFKSSLLKNSATLYTKRYSNSGHLIKTYKFHDFQVDEMLHKDTGGIIRIWVRHEDKSLDNENTFLPDVLF